MNTGSSREPLAIVIGASSGIDYKPTEVVHRGFEALMDGKECVIAGSTKTKLTNAANNLIPEQIKACRVKPGSTGGLSNG